MGQFGQLGIGYFEHIFVSIILVSVDISMCLSSLRLWAHASRVFQQSNQKCSTSFEAVNMILFDRESFNILLDGIRPLRYFALDFPSWFLDIKAALKDANIYGAIFLNKTSANWQAESFGYNLVIKSMSPFIAENFVDSDYVWEILDQLSSWQSCK